MRVLLLSSNSGKITLANLWQTLISTSKIYWRLIISLCNQILPLSRQLARLGYSHYLTRNAHFYLQKFVQPLGTLPRKSSCLPLYLKPTRFASSKQIWYLATKTWCPPTTCTRKFGYLHQLMRLPLQMNLASYSCLLDIGKHRGNLLQTPTPKSLLKPLPLML